MDSIVRPLVSGTIKSVKKKVQAQKPARIKKQLEIPISAIAVAKNLTTMKSKNHNVHKENPLAKLASSGLNISETTIKGTGPSPKQCARTKTERAVTGIQPRDFRSYSRDWK